MAEQIRDEIQDASAKRYMVEAGPDPYPVNDRTWLHMMESARANQLASRPLDRGQLTITNYYQRVQKQRCGGKRGPVVNPYLPKSGKGEIGVVTSSNPVQGDNQVTAGTG